MKVIINNCFGGFSFSTMAMQMYEERTGKRSRCRDSSLRTDPDMISIVAEIGDKADGYAADLRIVDIPDQYDFYISEYDGIESLHLRVKEDHLRELIRIGIEDDIVDYVIKTQ